MASNEQRRKASTPPAGEHQGVGIAGTAMVTGETFAVKALNYTEVDGQAMFEGDIALGRVGEIEAQNDAVRAHLDPNVESAVAIIGHRWPGGRIPYTIAADMPDQQRVTDAIAHWAAMTKITFVERTSEADYVEFISGSGCWSYVGRRGGKQELSIGPGCSTGNAIHEIGHTVGLWHEHSREDRDQNATIVWANIQEGMEHNFNQHITDGDDIGPYDYGSIMHYPETAFSKNGQPTIIPKTPGVTIGQRNGLSAGDVAAIEVMYPELYESKWKLVLDLPINRQQWRREKARRDVIGTSKAVRDLAGQYRPRGDLEPGAGYDPQVKTVQDPAPKQVHDPVPKKLRDDLKQEERLAKIMRDINHKVIHDPKQKNMVEIPIPGWRYRVDPWGSGLVPQVGDRVLPFALQTGHQDPMAVGYGGAGQVPDAAATLAAYDDQIEQVTDAMVQTVALLEQLRAERAALLEGLADSGM